MRGYKRHRRSVPCSPGLERDVDTGSGKTWSLLNILHQERKILSFMERTQGQYPIQHEKWPTRLGTRLGLRLSASDLRKEERKMDRVLFLTHRNKNNIFFQSLFRKKHFLQSL